MYRITTVLIASAMTAVLAAACSKDAAPGPTDPCTGTSGAIVPMQVGNWWIWRYSWTDYRGNPMMRFDTLSLVAEQDSVEFMHGEKNNYYISANNWYYYSKDGAVYSNANYMPGIVYLPPTLLIKYPMEFGETFSESGLVPTDVVNDPPQYWHRHITLLTCTSVQAPAGTFRCLKYVFWYEETSDQPSFIYAQPGLGIVKKENLAVAPSGDTTVTSTLELSSFRLFR